MIPSPAAIQNSMPRKPNNHKAGAAAIPVKTLARAGWRTIKTSAIKIAAAIKNESGLTASRLPPAQANPMPRGIGRRPASNDRRPHRPPSMEQSKRLEHISRQARWGEDLSIHQESGRARPAQIRLDESCWWLSRGPSPSRAHPRL